MGRQADLGEILLGAGIQRRAAGRRACTVPPLRAPGCACGADAAAVMEHTGLSRRCRPLGSQPREPTSPLHPHGGLRAVGVRLRSRGLGSIGPPSGGPLGARRGEALSLGPAQWASRAERCPPALGTGKGWRGWGPHWGRTSSLLLMCPAAGSPRIHLSQVWGGSEVTGLLPFLCTAPCFPGNYGKCSSFEEVVVFLRPLWFSLCSQSLTPSFVMVSVRLLLPGTSLAQRRV